MTVTHDVALGFWLGSVFWLAFIVAEWWRR